MKKILFISTFCVLVAVFAVMVTRQTRTDVTDKTIPDETVADKIQIDTKNTDGSPFCIMDPPIDQPNIGMHNWNYYKDLGIKWMELAAENERFGWQSMEKEKGKYDFAASDKNVCDFYSREINVIYVTRPVNSLYGTHWNERATSNEYPVGYLKEWGNFIKALVERYDGDGQNDGSCEKKIKIKYFQIAHELSPFGDDYWVANPDKYAEVFEIAYEKMKEACAGCVLAMPVPMLDDLKKEKNFLSDVLSILRGKNIADIALNYHYWGPYADRLKYIEKLKEISSRYGFDQSKIKILSNESGATAIGNNGETEQAGELVKSYVAGGAHGQTKQCWTRIYDYSGGGILWENIGLVKNSGKGESYKKLAYYSYKKLIEKLGEADWNNIDIIQEKDGVYAYKFTKQGKSVWVVWNDSGTEKRIMVSGISSAQVAITTAIPKYASGKDVIDYATAFNVETKSVSESKLTITLYDKPVFVEEK